MPGRAPFEPALVDPLFQPFKLKSLDLANRIVMAPMTRGFSPGGTPGADVAGYYRRRAEGGVGLIITEGVGVDHPAALGGGGVDGDNAPHMYGEPAMAGWRRVVDAVHAAGGAIVPQLWHQGVMREAGTGPHPEVASVRPSGLWGPEGRTATVSQAVVDRLMPPTSPMTESEIGDVIRAFARSARHAVGAGFDGVALHGAHGYLIDSFLWGGTNTRTDHWGGDCVSRTAFAVALIREIRREIGEGTAIVLRFSQWKQQDVRARLANSPAELEQVLGPLSDAGVDVFDASQRFFDRPEFEGSPLNLAGWARQVTGKPAITVGGVGLSKGVYDSRSGGGAVASSNIPALVARFERGEFDLVGVGRSLLQDPSWTRKLREGRPFEDFNEASRLHLT